ncbi:hypothetical protein [Paraburkholderia ultramafica]|uniref:hypothetical protein n=1 Tax=Paraburkholderia ultramafica TaxID=1544867 RepID=UPI001581B76E|nr:hypothetical protein [Paraburkholderia ultramafica]
MRDKTEFAIAAPLLLWHLTTIGRDKNLREQIAMLYARTMFDHSLIIDCLGELKVMGALEHVLHDGLTGALTVTDLGVQLAAGVYQLHGEDRRP